MENINIQGIDYHIGSQITELAPFIDATDRLLALIDELITDDINIKHLDFGGGLGVTYKDEQPPLPFEYISALSVGWLTTLK